MWFQDALLLVGRVLGKYKILAKTALSRPNRALTFCHHRHFSKVAFDVVDLREHNQALAATPAHPAPPCPRRGDGGGQCHLPPPPSRHPRHLPPVAKPHPTPHTPHASTPHTTGESHSEPTTRAYHSPQPRKQHQMTSPDVSSNTEQGYNSGQMSSIR